MAKVTNVMATEMALDVMKASTDLKALTQVVSANQSAWKAQTAALKSAGDYVGAYEAKVEGLGDSIKAQGAKLDALKDKQSDLGLETSKDAQKFVELKDKIDELKSKQSDLDQTTDEGKSKFKELGTQISELTEQQDKLSPATVKLAEDYEKYQRQINQTEAQIVSLKAQQDRAKDSLDYQKSGLVEIQQAYENNNRVMQAHVERLKAEGNEDEANRTKLNGLTEGLGRLNEKYDLQVAELERLESAQNKDNEAIANQKIRVDETATAMAKAKSETNELRESMGKQPNAYFLSMRDKVLQLKTAEEATAKQSRHLGDIIKGSFLGNTLSNAFGMLTFDIGETVKAGYESAEVATEMSEKWKNMGASTSNVNSLGLAVKSLKENTNLSATAVGNLVTRFYSTTGSVQQAKALSKGVGSLSDQLKLSQSQSDAFANGLSKIESAGTVTSSSLGRLEKSAPGLTTALQKASGMSQQAFSQLVSSGKMTSTQFNQILTKASKDYKENSAEFDKSSAGAMKHMQQTWADTRQALMKPLVETSATGLTSLNKALNNKQTQAGVEKLGEGIAKLATKTAVLIDFMAKHQTAVATFGKALIGAFAVKKVMSGVTAFSLGLSRMVIALKGYTTAAETTAVTQKALNVAMKANIFIAVASAIVAIGVALVELYKHSKTFRDAMNKLGNTLKNVFTGSIKWVAEWGRNMKKGWDEAKTATSKGVKDVGRFISNLVTSAGKNLSNLWNGTKSIFRNGWTDVTNASKSGAHNVGNWFGNMANDTRKTAVKMFNDHKATFRSGYDVLNSFTQTWHDVTTGKWGKVGTDLKNISNSIKAFVHSIFSDMYNKLNDMTGGRLGDMVKWWQDKMKAIGDTVSNAKTSIHKHFVDLVRDIIKPFNDMLSGLEKGINWVLDKVGASKISGDWSIPMPSYAQGTKDTHQGGLALVNDGNGTNYREMYHLPNGQIGMFPAVKNMIVPLPKGTSVLNGDSSAQLAKAMHLPGYASGVGDFFSGLWNGAKDVLDDTEDILKKPAEFMESLFNHFLGNTSSKISLANDILTSFPKTLANDAVKWVKKMFNTLNNTLDSNASGPKATGDHLHWLKQAGVPDSWTSSMSWLINAESGWNPHARNGSSGAYGIPQSLPASKLASAGKDWKDNPITQIKWMVNYIKGRYGTAMAAESFHKRVGWYANGGIATTPSIFGEAGAEMAIPLNTMSSSRAWQLLGQVVDYYRGGGTNSTNVTTNNADVVAELKSVKSYLAALVGLGTDQIAATKGIVGYDENVAYRKTATDQGIASFQSFS
jgi:tape measure domain-containing protein